MEASELGDEVLVSPKLKAEAGIVSVAIVAVYHMKCNSPGPPQLLITAQNAYGVPAVNE